MLALLMPSSEAEDSGMTGREWRKIPFVYTNVHLADATEPASCLVKVSCLITLRTPPSAESETSLCSFLRDWSASVVNCRFSNVINVVFLIMAQRNGITSVENSYRGSGTPRM